MPRSLKTYSPKYYIMVYLASVTVKGKTLWKVWELDRVLIKNIFTHG